MNDEEGLDLYRRETAAIRYENNKRRALVDGAQSREQLARYLPGNYEIVAENPDGTFVIEGEDVAGWTLDGYVMPRLASGLIGSVEINER